MAKVSKGREKEATDRLHELLKPGDTVHTILRHVSRSGMMRRISPLVLKDGESWHLDALVGDLLGYPRAYNGEGIKVSGCGMDMGFHLVSTLSRILYPEGFGCIGEGCPSNDHSNGDRDYTPHGNGMDSTRREVLIGKDHWHNSGDYAIKHRWL